MRDLQAAAVIFSQKLRHPACQKAAMPKGGRRIFLMDRPKGRPCQKSADALLVSKPGSAGAPSGFSAEAKTTRNYRLIPFPNPSQNHLAAFWQCRPKDGNGNSSAAARRVTAGDAPLTGLGETRKYAPEVWAVPPQQPRRATPDPSESMECELKMPFRVVYCNICRCRHSGDA